MGQIEYKYFIEQDGNCAESTLLSLCEKYGIEMDRETMKLVSAFGAGMGCGKTCGALCGAMAVLGKLKVEGRAHATPDFASLCADFVAKFENDLGGTDCSVLKPMYRTDELRCLKTVELTTKCFDEYMKALDEKNAESGAESGADSDEERENL